MSENAERDDRADRAHAAHAYDENVVVVAGAGTGKTSLLIERIVCQMVDRELEIADFAAITFTEKAAAEMRKRLGEELARLRDHARNPPALTDENAKHAADRAYLWLIGRHPAERIARIAELRLRDLVGAEISTIHGFCAGLLRKHPLESQVDPGFSVDTGLQFEDLQREIWRDFLSGANGPDGERTALWRRVLHRLDLAEIEQIANRCASFAVAEQIRARGLLDLPELFAPAADFWLRQIDAHLAGSPAKGPESWLDAARGPLRALRDDGLASFRSALASAVHQRVKGDPENLLDRAPPTSTSNKPAGKLAERVQSFFLRFRLIEDALLSEVLELVGPHCDAVQRSARLRGLLPFDALLSLAADLLRNGSNTGVRRALGARYKVLFVDEFQDTDPLQYEIVLFLAEDPESGPASDAYSCRLAPGKLFIVGDPKQAIYRFRGADISACGTAIRQIVKDCGGTERKLVTNFRAPAKLLRPLNALLESVLKAPDSESQPDRASAYPEYDPLVSGCDPVEPAGVEIWTVGEVGVEMNADEARLAEANAIADRVAAEIAYGPLRPRGVALLFRALTDVHVYARALQARGVPCLIGRSEDPERQPAGQQLLALLRALQNPADSPAVLGVLRSPLGAVADAELSLWAGRFAGLEREACWSYPDVEPPAAELPDLARAFSLLRELRTLAREVSLEALLAALVDRTPLLAIHASASDGERRVADLWLLVERLVEVAQATPGRDLADLVRNLESEERRSISDESDEGPDAVRLSTIHGVKGLEFPVVILPDLSRGKGGGRDRPVQVEVLRERKVLAIATRAGISATWIARERAEELHENAQNARVFYVACTRARRRLVFVNAPRKSTAPADAYIHYLGREPWSYPPEGLAIDGVLPGVDGVITRTVPVPARGETPPPTAGATATAAVANGAIDRASRAVEKAQAAARSPFASPSGLREDAEAHALESDLEDPAEKPRDTEERHAARALGTLIHDALERWDFRDADALRTLVQSAAERIAAGESLPVEPLTREARKLADGLIASDLPEHLAGVEVLGRELPVLFRDSADGPVWNGTIDLLYRDANGRLVVADYKTDRAPDDAARAHYRAQLSTYARGVMKIFPGETVPALELIWLRSGIREPLPLESSP